MINQPTGGLKAVPSREELEKNLEKNPYVDQFVKQGAKLLEQTNRPNVITVEQFAPYVALYKVDLEKYEEEDQYRLHISRLFQQFRVNLSINMFEPTLVVRSQEDQTVVYHLNRVFTRIRPDAVPEGTSARLTIPPIGPRTPKDKRENLMVNAVLTDVSRANNTPEQLKEFLRMRGESALIKKRFVEHNLSPDKRSDFLQDEAPASVGAVQEDASSIMFGDDDD
jgi:hypothetical protein